MKPWYVPASIQTPFFILQLFSKSAKRWLVDTCGVSTAKVLLAIMTWHAAGVTADMHRQGRDPATSLAWICSVAWVLFDLAYELVSTQRDAVWASGGCALSALLSAQAKIRENMKPCEGKHETRSTPNGKTSR